MNRAVRLKFVKSPQTSGDLSGNMHVERPIGDGLLLGRKCEDIPLADPRVSRRHALLYMTEQKSLRLRDLGTSNGTFVNGKKIIDATIRAGDHIRMGDTEMIVVELPNESIPEGYWPSDCIE